MSVSSQVLTVIEDHPWLLSGEIYTAYVAAWGEAAVPNRITATISQLWADGQICRCGPRGAYRYSASPIPWHREELMGLLDRIHGRDWYLHSTGPHHAVSVRPGGPNGERVVCTPIFADQIDALHAALGLDVGEAS